MQKVFDEVNSLDKRCYEKFGLTEDILMENASISMMNYIQSHCHIKDTILIVCGAGNNGADGIVLGRLLHQKYKVSLYIPFGAKSHMATFQLQRAKKIGVKIAPKITKADVIVDCLFGTGLNKDLNKQTISIIDTINQIDAHKIACDIPSGINSLGQITTKAVYVDTTITMGALKKSLFTDAAKEYVGNIIVSNLGIQRKLYEIKSNRYLLDKEDLKLPLRDNKVSNKGTYGHLSVVLGEKKGAGVLCAQAGFSFGCGLISVITDGIQKLPNSIMQNKTLPTKATSLCIGMGLGNLYNKVLLENDLPKVIDADLFYDKQILKILNQNNIVLTPHPKEFCSLLKLTKLADITVKQLQQNRFKYVELFCKKYKQVVLLLKGTNVIIAQGKNSYINSFGSSVLSKGGSGDVLCGLIGALLAQGYKPLEAALNGSLAHTFAALNYSGNNYSMTPEDLINEIKKL